MAITELGLSFDAESDESSNSIRIMPDGDGAPIYAKWRTSSGTEWQGSFELAISYRGVPRGVDGSGSSGKGDWSEWFCENIPAEECNPHRTDGRDGWQWSHPVDIGGLLVAMAPEGLAYAARIFDEIELQMKVKSHYVEGRKDRYGRTYSATLQAKAWIGYFPDYRLTALYFGKSGDLTAEYEVEGWERLDDRWCLESFVQDGEEIKSPSSLWGTLDRSGKIAIPTTALTRLPRPGPARLRIRINASYKSIGYSLAEISGEYEVEDRSVANTPRLSAVALEGGAVKVEVTDSGDKGIPISSASVKMRGGPYSFDEQKVEVGGSATFPFPPFGSELWFDAVGFGEDAVSARAETLAPAIDAEGMCFMQPVEGGEAVHLRLDLERAWSGSREMEIEKLSGRERPSVFYGVGGEASETVSGVILDRDGHPVERQRAAAFRALAHAGVCMVRSPEGERMLAAVESVSHGRPHGSLLETVSVQLREVSE